MLAASFKDYLSTLSIEGEEIKFYDLKKFGDKYYKLPYSIRILLESALRNCDEFQVRKCFSSVLNSFIFEQMITKASEMYD